jgi:hypothetical protein
MNQIVIDNTLLIAALLCSFAVSFLLKKRKTGVVFAGLLLFPPLLIFLNMWAHTTAVAVANIRRFNAGQFQYTFTVYSHFLFGVVFIALSGFTIHLSKKYITGFIEYKRNILVANLVTSLFFVPLILINPIGALPVIASIFSSVLLWVWRPFRKKHQYTQEKVMATAETGVQPA